MSTTKNNRMVQPYLFFGGRCEEAVEFYRKTLGAKVEMLTRFKDSPDPSMCAPGSGDKVMHASFRVGETTVMASDGRCEGRPSFQGFSLSLTVPNEAEAERPFVISRIFDAPRERMWKAWTERDRLMQWFGPKGFKMSVAKMDFRPGGTFHYCLRSPDGHEMWGKFVYREIVAPERIVLVNSFSDEKGGLTRHPMSPTWPREMLSTFTLTEQAGRTIVTIEWIPLNPAGEERKTFDSSHDGMKQGWTGTFDQLADYLAAAKEKP